MPKINNLILIFCVLLISCDQSETGIGDIELTDNNNTKAYLNNLSSYQVTVITFLSPECPVSENYTKTLNDITSKYSQNNNLQFINIFPGKFYSDKEITNFIQKFSLKQNNLFDKSLSLTRYLNASITPETFVLNKNGEIMYSGAIDNWVVELGTKRQVTTDFYLEDAINSIINGQEVIIKKTEAVGCYIETR